MKLGVVTALAKSGSKKTVQVHPQLHSSKSSCAIEDFLSKSKQNKCNSSTLELEAVQCYWLYSEFKVSLRLSKKKTIRFVGGAGCGGTHL